jgi:Glycosyl transferase family 2
MNKPNPVLTIMIPTTIDRKEMFLELLEEIETQVHQHDLLQEVEVVCMEDDKEISVGKKRQLILEAAKGEWVSGIDSDDWIHEDYIKDIVAALKNNPEVDHVGFIEECDIDGQKSMSIFSIKHKSWDDKEEGYDQVRCANPKSVIRRSIALQVGYEDSRFGEDRVFSEAVTPLLKSEVFIKKPLYQYRYVSIPNENRYGIIH